MAARPLWAAVTSREAAETGRRRPPFRPGAGVRSPDGRPPPAEGRPDEAPATLHLWSARERRQSEPAMPVRPPSPAPRVPASRCGTGTSAGVVIRSWTSYPAGYRHVADRHDRAPTPVDSPITGPGLRRATPPRPGCADPGPARRAAPVLPGEPGSADAAGGAVAPVTAVPGSDEAAPDRQVVTTAGASLTARGQRPPAGECAAPPGPCRKPGVLLHVPVGRERAPLRGRDHCCAAGASASGAAPAGAGTVTSSTKQYAQLSPGSAEAISGWSSAAACARACRRGEESQHPT
ncbi:hypothetical protein BD833_106188 [Blastococcus xanthinilyticus]|uniref:Uncharacterized protein n=1 Tax=Blastococcus xanthinilyticus TaxID=1564164 RepID=A0A5S5CUZ2_9ACTN|nr:hypothetical protein BD833_106188 [Blastococcus xanthinilyticus]